MGRDPAEVARAFDVAERADRYRLQLESFARAIRGDEPPLLGRDDAVAQARTLDALFRSAETRLPASP